MSSTIINLILWIPFLIAFGICAVFFMRSGYKRGVISALISLGATVAGAIISLILANLIAIPIAPAIASLLPVSSSGGIMEAFTARVAEGIVEGFVSLLLFSVFMLIATLVFKRIAKKLEKDQFQTEEKKKKWGGLGVRFADALIFAILLLLPLYGTLSAYAPTARILVEMDGGRENSELLGALEASERHPCVYLSKPAPIAAIYNGLTTIDMNDDSISIPEILSVFEEAYERGEEIVLDVKDNKLDEDKLVDYIDFLSEEVVEESWAYAITGEIINVASNEMENLDIEEDHEYKHFWKPIIEDMPLNEDIFRENGKAALDFVKFVLKNMPDPDLNLRGEEEYKYLAEKGFFKELGKLGNATNEAVFIKNCVYSTLAAEYLGNDSDAVSEFMKNYPAKAITDQKLLNKDGEALWLFMEGDYVTALLTAPGIGADAFERVIERVDALELFESSKDFLSPAKLDYIENNEGFRQRLCDFLHLCEGSPYTDYSAFDYYYPCIASLMTEDICRPYSFISGAEIPGALKTALRLLTEEYFLLDANNPEAAKNAYFILKDFAEGMAEEESAEGDYDLATDCLHTLLNIMDASYKDGNSQNYNFHISTNAIRFFVISPVASEIAKDIIKAKGEDPYGAGKRMGESLRAELLEKSNACYDEMTGENTGFITVFEYNAETGVAEEKQIAIKDITDEQLEMFGITRAELEARNLTEDQIRDRLTLFKKLFGI